MKGFTEPSASASFFSGAGEGVGECRHCEMPYDGSDINEAGFCCDCVKLDLVKTCNECETFTDADDLHHDTGLCKHCQNEREQQEQEDEK